MEKTGSNKHMKSILSAGSGPMWLVPSLARIDWSICHIWG